VEWVVEGLIWTM